MQERLAIVSAVEAGRFTDEKEKDRRDSDGDVITHPSITVDITSEEEEEGGKEEKDKEKPDEEEKEESEEDSLNKSEEDSLNNIPLWQSPEGCNDPIKMNK